MIGGEENKENLLVDDPFRMIETIMEKIFKSHPSLSYWKADASFSGAAAS
jgi:hypothetical protein